MVWEWVVEKTTIAHAEGRESPSTADERMWR
jgi:hypothetical protein